MTKPPGFGRSYDQYTAELTKIGDQETALIKKYADQWGTMTDEQASRLTTRSLAVDEQIAQLRVKYMPIFSNAVQGKVAATFFQLDRRIPALIDIQLASQIALVQPRSRFPYVRQNFVARRSCLISELRPRRISMNWNVIFARTKPWATDTAVPFVKCLMILVALTLSPTVSALPQSAELQEKLAAVKQAAAENKQRLLQYQWIETTQLTLKGDQKPPTENSCRYGPDGQVQKTPIGPPPQQPSGGRMKRKIIEKKKKEMKDYMQDVKGVLAMYVPPDPQRMQQAYQAGNLALNPVPGAVNLVFSNYAQPSDKMTLTFNTATKKIAALSVDTYLGEAKDKVTLQVQMGSLPDGTNYVQQSVLNASAKELTVTTTNSKYQKP